MTLRRVACAAATAALGLTVAAVPQGGWSQDGDLLILPLDEVLPLDQPFQPPGGESIATDNVVTEDVTSDVTLGDPPASGENDVPPLVDAPKARLRGLDTLTNTVNDFEIRVGETLAFKRLIVSLDACRYPRGDLAGEAFAFLRIRDQREIEDRFSGWMLASSPALSALDHPRYDIWVLSCNTD